MPSKTASTAISSRRRERKLKLQSYADNFK